MPAPKLAFAASKQKEAQQALAILLRRHDAVAMEDADIVIALGGDGFMLRTLHDIMLRNLAVSVYGMNRGTVGFLLNDFKSVDLLQRLAAAQTTVLNPLRMQATDVTGAHHEALAINEVSLFRETRQAAHIQISIDGRVRMEELVCDGVMVATPAGSSAYNLSAHGPILPLGSGTLALTPISAFRPRRWRGALLPKSCTVRFKVLEGGKRPVGVVADNQEIRDVAEITIAEESAISLRLLFDPEHNLEERILNEQFIP